VRNPAAAQSAAQVDPAGPPPTIATSTTSIGASLSKKDRGDKGISRLQV
jgi:hypothetical protein